MYFTMDDDGDVLAAVRLQSGVQRHVVEHLADLAPMVQIIDAPVPQTGEELVHFFNFLVAHSPVEQVVDVPKISQDRTQQRLVDYLR